MKGLDFLGRLFHRRQAEAEPSPLPSKPKARGPVEHGPTKAPFSRRLRQERNRAASHSRARNRT